MILVLACPQLHLVLDMGLGNLGDLGGVVGNLFVVGEVALLHLVFVQGLVRLLGLRTL